MIVALNAGPILRHFSTCVLCRSYVSTHAATGTKDDYDGLCRDGAKLLATIEAALRAQGLEPTPPREAAVPS